ncbi:MAG: hypothetical protein JW955_12160 [Sedimentisphaerales bacterium]|nr:hypothetical protein [Sedimentisphaerales bacterium]
MVAGRAGGMWDWGSQSVLTAMAQYVSLGPEVKIKMSEITFIAERSDEDGYVAKALGYSISTEGEPLEESKNSIKDAVKRHFEEAERPRIARLHMVKDEVMAL